MQHGDNVAARIALITSGTRTISQLARESGVERTRLNRAILGQFELTADERTAVASVLGRDVAELFPEATDA